MVDGANRAEGAIVNVEVDQAGKVSYDAIVKGGTNSDKLVYSKLSDRKSRDPIDISLPTEQEEQETAARTGAALMALVSSKVALDKPTGSAMIQAATSQNHEEKTQFIKYTPRPDAPGYNPVTAAQRVIQMVPAQIDPMEPPKHRHIKAPRGPAEDPVPVLHAPPAKLTKEERDQWNIPACISNWKNARGYTIPLDKRLAADGRGLREHTINPNFATLSESLYVAERQAREEVNMRAQVQKRLAMQEKERREEELRQLAQKARMERGGVIQPDNLNDRIENDSRVPSGLPIVDYGSDDDDDDDDENDRNTRKAAAPRSEEDVAAEQRERLRMERKRERERELRLEQSSMTESKKRRLEEERDVSEKIALGVHTGSGGGLGGQVDSRLYNQTGGLTSGYGADDEYNTYSKPLFGDGAASSSIYRPTRGETEYNADEQYDKLQKGATTKFQPDKGFSGADGGRSSVAGGASRNAPVQFEKQRK
eukprot:CAMPEP_0118688070 /NCGR_PEP_ID=MMETSP0800-20121206/8723_1 /TAXON_ID=210618 ORGANISM="Striatella unipunctata, Strain CCMP2910" /NCGR_SAMPLE_ID=MMETSP0800 /ASSEMBLY_ACC=CAM_ASM_000638 /LENGTH=480 /DNA_ID=CAMNT_0006585303 /DNA_START=128 /DNA_END=1570 /DNA_ORIENTATION=-